MVKIRHERDVDTIALEGFHPCTIFLSLKTNYLKFLFARKLATEDFQGPCGLDHLFVNRPGFNSPDSELSIK